MASANIDDVRRLVESERDTQVSYDDTGGVYACDRLLARLNTLPTTNLRQLAESERDAWQAQHAADGSAESLGGFSALDQLLDQQGAGVMAPRFKSLAWIDCGQGNFMAKTPFGSYHANCDRMLFTAGETACCESIEHGKQLADADWQRRLSEVLA